MTAFVIPQVKGTILRSHGVDGVAESLVKSKKYVIPLAILSPEVTGGVVVAYLVDGRLKLPKNTPYFNIGDDEVTGPLAETLGGQQPLGAAPPATVSVLQNRSTCAAPRNDA
jgi:hypothetical protein